MTRPKEPNGRITSHPIVQLTQWTLGRGYTRRQVLRPTNNERELLVTDMFPCPSVCGGAVGWEGSLV